MGASPASLLPYALSVCGLAEIGDFATAGITHALSILDPGWPDPDAFGDFTDCRRAVFRFHDVIDEAKGMVAPSRDDLRRILALGDRLRSDGVGHLLIHCHAGVSRSAAAAASLLAQYHPGGEDEAFRQLAAIRPWSWPNSRMIVFADGLLGRRGRLIAAMRSHHRRMIERWPQLAASLREGERAREYWREYWQAG
jgi:predicted protein tyrosine phosphatase